VRAAPSEGFVRRYARKTLKGNLSSTNQMVDRLMDDEDRGNLYSFLELQRNLASMGRPVFPSRRWKNDRTRIAYTVRLTGKAPTAVEQSSGGSGGDGCYETAILVDLSQQEDPQLRDVSRELIGLFCRTEAGGWKLQPSPAPSGAGRKPS